MPINSADAQAFFQNIDQPVFTTNPRGIIQAVNSAFEEATGYSSEDAVGEPARFMEAEESAARSFESRIEPLNEHTTWEGLVALRHPDDSTYRVFQTLVPLVGEDGVLQGYAAHNLDLMRLAGESQAFQDQTFKDEVTGLPNRLQLQNRIQEALDELKRDPAQGFTLMFLDLDDFHRIANSLGREIGRQILAMVGNRVESPLRLDDTASGGTTARFGSDEFVVLLEGTQQPRHAQAIIERLLESIRDPMRVEDHELQLDATAGIVFSSPDYERAEALIRDADTAMHRARNHEEDYAFFTDTMQDELVYQLRMESDLRQAFDNDELELHYQPIVTVATGELEGFEALIRWSHPDKGLIKPHEFLPEAERSGLIVPLGRWVLEEAVRQLQHWIEKGVVTEGIMMSVNHSPSELAEEEFLDAVEGVLTQHDVPRESLHLEFTETTVAQNVERMDERIHALAQVGVRLCVDDFGSGYSAIERLLRWPIDAMKIDRTFVQGMAEDEQQRHLTRGILEFARENQFHVIAEGIETHEEHQLLQEWDCPAAQGYYYAKPMPADDVVKYLEGDR